MSNSVPGIRKAVTFRASSIGDALNAKYFFENVHSAYPKARCALVVAGRVGMIRDLLAAYPWIQVIEVNRRHPWTMVKLWRAFGRSDLVLIPPAKAGSSFSFLSKLAARVLARRAALTGFEDASGINSRIYDRVIPLNPTQAPRRSEQDALKAAGIPIAQDRMQFQYVPQPNLLSRLELEPKKYIALHLFAGSENRGPSKQKRQAIIDALAKALPNTPIALTGSASERTQLEALVLPTNVRVLAGDLSVQELAALMAESVCVISVGSGPSHIASSLGVPVLVLVTCHGIPWVGEEQYGAGAPIQIFSDTAVCIDGHDHARAYPACIEGIDVDEVAHAAAEHIRP